MTLNAHMDDRGELINRSGANEAPVPERQSRLIFLRGSLRPARAGQREPAAPAGRGRDAGRRGGATRNADRRFRRDWSRASTSTAAASRRRTGSVVPVLDSARSVRPPRGWHGIQRLRRVRGRHRRRDSSAAGRVPPPGLARRRHRRLQARNEDHYDPLQPSTARAGSSSKSPPRIDRHRCGARRDHRVQRADPNEQSLDDGAVGSLLRVMRRGGRAEQRELRHAVSARPAERYGRLPRHPSDDGINLRFFQPKRRFGVAPYYPVSRYVNVEFTSPIVPKPRPRARQPAATTLAIKTPTAIASIHSSRRPSRPTPTQELCALAS